MDAIGLCAVGGSGHSLICSHLSMLCSALGYREMGGSLCFLGLLDVAHATEHVVGWVGSVDLP